MTNETIRLLTGGSGAGSACKLRAFLNPPRCGDRIVCRRRAAHLRKRGDRVRWIGWSAAGQSLYAWAPGARAAS